MKLTSPNQGQIITFYSYKGGTGRSMALANVACLLAQKWIKQEEKILMVDWDLEAPGLHQFFRGKIDGNKNNNLAKEHLGLIDWFSDIKTNAEKLALSDEEINNEFFDRLNIETYFAKTTIPSLYLMPAGRSDDSLYSSRVNSFDWNELFSSYPSLILKFAEYLREKFRYVVIDSRTGYTDISGICTSIMPEKLVVVFTPSRQSLTGVLELIQKSTEYRKQSDDLHPLIVFPLVSRVEGAERELQRDWRFGDQDSNIIGYQPQFELTLKDVYKLPNCDLTEFFDEVQLQYIPRYSYGEEIAVLSERTEDRLSLARSYENFTQRLVNLNEPWKTSNPSSRKLRVFLSHSSYDKPVVREIYRRLLNDDWIDPWFDEEVLLPGQSLDIEIENAARAADVIIVCLSKNSIAKEDYVKGALKYVLDIALEKANGEVFIVPMRLDNCELPLQLKMWHSSDYFPAKRRDAAFELLRKSLENRANSLGIAPISQPTPPKVFISYSHKDEKFKDQLVTMLIPLQDQEILEIWQDRQIEPGDEWYQAIKDAINTCDMSIFLISANFLASRFIRDGELSRLLQKRKDDGLHVIPIIISPCLWQSVPLLKDLQALPRDGRPIVNFVGTRQRDSVWAEIAKAIGNRAKSLNKRVEQRAKQKSDVVFY